MQILKTTWILLVSFSMVFFLTTGCDGGDNSSAQMQKTEQKASSEKSDLIKGDAEAGKSLYVQNCSVCHGENGLGVKGLGKDLVHSEYVDSLSDAELLKYVNEGRTVDDPRNTTGIPMPPKGGNPALTDQQIMHIIAYMRLLQEDADKSEK
ncbi:MAG: cytochrome c [Calditrichaeota bacterium]|nr:cytochrome c [Calditrichota bacterium]RQV98390.1 MAG: cytochrome c [Calditrichota bacterium]